VAARSDHPNAAVRTFQLISVGASRCAPDADVALKEGRLRAALVVSAVDPKRKL
jgi:hypothetical protein